LNLELFIAKKINSPQDSKNNISQSIIRIATIAIALSLAIMILAVSIITGFKKEITAKVIGFGSHITIMNHDTNTSYETVPIDKKQDFYPSITQLKGVKHIQVFAIKAGIIKTKTEIQGVVLKGVDKDFDWSFFEKNIIEGTHFNVNDTSKTKNILISNYQAKLLKLGVGDDVFIYFIQNPPRLRKYKIVGIYETGLQEYDEKFVLADINDIQKLNDWKLDNTELISGFEILIDDYDDLTEMTETVRDAVGYKFDDKGSKLKVENILQLNPQIFDWLNLTNMNVIVILVIMIFVSAINMVTGLLIIILERTNMIGILKSLGCSDWNIRKIFIYNASFIMAKGLFWGNLIGIFICLMQYFFKIIPLDPSSYYVNTVPINFSLWHLFLLNFGTLIITILVLLIPSYIITKIDPIKAINFN